VREQAGLDVVSLVPAGGESGAAFWLRERDGAAWLLKVTREPVSGLQALDALTGRLRARGYPAPRLRATAQAGLGGGGADWRHLITTTLLAGGDGYGLHSTMTARPDTRDMLAALRGIGASCGSAIPPGVDFTHFDFHFLNLLSDGATITGVVDINPPPLAGDRAFDLATLVFYVYDHDELRRRILDRLFGLAGRQAARAYLALMVLRQVEWSVRHYPAAPATRRHLRLARLILGDIGEPGPSRYVLR
jgi:hypothetical protein